MSESGRISVNYVVNASEFNKNITQMKKNLQLCTQEVKNSAKEINLYGNNIQTLTSKQKAIQSAISQSEKIISAYSQNIEKNKAALTANKNELEKLAAKKKEANSAFKDAVKMYGEESEEAKKLKDSLDDVSEQYSIMQSKIKGNENAITSNTAQLEKQRGTLLDLKTQLKQTNQELELQSSKFIKASESFSSWGKKLESLGGSLSSIGGEAQKAGGVIVASASALAKLASGAETGFAKVNTLANDSGESLERYKESVYQLSNESGKSVNDLTDALYDAISAGVDYGDSVKFIEAANKVSVGGFTEVGDASNLLTQIMNIYGKTVEDVSKVSDQLFVVQEDGVVTVADLASNMGEAMTMGANYNVALEDILASYASLTKQGRTASTAQTQLKAMIQELGDTGSSVGKVLEEKTGKSFTALSQEGKTLYDCLKIVKDSCEGNEDAFNNLWSSTEAGLSAMSLLSNEGKYFNDTMKNLENSTGKTDKAFEKMANTSDFKFKKSLNQLKNEATKLGESLLPLMDTVSDGISKISSVISKANPETITAVAKFGALALAFGTLGKAAGGIISVLGKGAQGISTVLELAGKTKVLGSFSTALEGIEGGAGLATQGLAKLALGINPVTLGIGAFVTAAAVGFKEYNDVLESSSIKAKEDYNIIEQAVASLGGITLESKEQLIENGDVYSEWSSKVSESTQDVLEDIASKSQSINLAIDSIQFDGIITDSELQQTKAKVDDWANTIIEQINANKDPIYQAMYDLFNQDNLIDEQEQQILDGLNTTSAESTKIIQSNENEINGIIQTAQEERRSLTEDENRRIQELQKQSNEVALNNLNISNEEKEAASKQFWERCTQMTTKELSKQLTEEKSKMDENIAAIKEKYDEKIQNAKVAADHLNGVEKERVEEEIRIMQSNRDTEIQNENEKWQSIIAAGEQNHAKQMEKINQYTGEEMSQGDLKCKARLEQESQFYSNLNSITEDGVYQVYNTQTQSWDNLVVDVDEATGQIIAFAKTQADETGMHAGEIVGYNKQIENSMLDTQANWVVGVNRMIQSMSEYAGSVQNGEMTTDEAMAQIKADIDSGKISISDFGFTSESAFLQSARSMIDAKSKGDDLKSSLNNIPKKVETTVTVDTSDADTRIMSLREALAQISNTPWATTVTVNREENVTVTKTETVLQGNTLRGVTPGAAIGTVTSEDRVMQVNEMGEELIDNVTSTPYVLTRSVVGDTAYLPANTRVTNALMSRKTLSQQVDYKIEVAMSEFSKNLERTLINTFKKATVDKDVSIVMNNPNFIDKGSEKANINYIKNLFNSEK